MTDWHNSLEDYLAGSQEPSQESYGLDERSAGHTWREDVHGRVCTYCGRRWAEVVGATEEAINQHHYAHSQHLVDWEQKQLAREVDWLWKTIVDAASAGK